MGRFSALPGGFDKPIWRLFMQVNGHFSGLPQPLRQDVTVSDVRNGYERAATHEFGSGVSSRWRPRGGRYPRPRYSGIPDSADERSCLVGNRSSACAADATANSASDMSRSNTVHPHAADSISASDNQDRTRPAATTAALDRVHLPPGQPKPGRCSIHRAGGGLLAGNNAQAEMAGDHP